MRTWSGCGSACWTGRPLAKGEAGPRRHPQVVRRVEGGDPRYERCSGLVRPYDEAFYLVSPLGRIRTREPAV